MVFPKYWLGMRECRIICNGTYSINYIIFVRNCPLYWRAQTIGRVALTKMRQEKSDDWNWYEQKGQMTKWQNGLSNISKHNFKLICLHIMWLQMRWYISVHLQSGGLIINISRHHFPSWTRPLSHTEAVDLTETLTTYWSTSGPGIRFPVIYCHLILTPWKDKAWRHTKSECQLPLRKLINRARSITVLGSKKISISDISADIL